VASNDRFTSTKFLLTVQFAVFEDRQWTVLPATTVVAPICSLFPAMFRSISAKIGSNTVEEHSYNTWTSYVNQLLAYSTEAKNVFLSSQCLYYEGMLVSLYFFLFVVTVIYID
jgi:hypothetical protein